MKRFVVLMADDDEDDCLLLKKAFEENGDGAELHFVTNGQELLDYLRRQGKFADNLAWPCPDLVLLDLNMPIKDGRQALSEIKSDPALKHIPVVILTTSGEARDISLTYGNGASSFITKPAGFIDWNEMVKAIIAYWFRISTLPARGKDVC